MDFQDIAKIERCHEELQSQHDRLLDDIKEGREELLHNAHKTKKDIYRMKQILGQFLHAKHAVALINRGELPGLGALVTPSKAEQSTRSPAEYIQSPITAESRGSEDRDFLRDSTTGPSSPHQRDTTIDNNSQSVEHTPNPTENGNDVDPMPVQVPVRLTIPETRTVPDNFEKKRRHEEDEALTVPERAEKKKKHGHGEDEGAPTVPERAEKKNHRHGEALTVPERVEKKKKHRHGDNGAEHSREVHKKNQKPRHAERDAANTASTAHATASPHGREKSSSKQTGPKAEPQDITLVSRDIQP
ncbi:hypothetical protein DACRYDRAFT_115329 [Dacryopinax primogenitus]|uniref:Uncharacterized protein n=1 Tax=Dacryopinax primogenitus (strain DJM 731) TaxID=1858805 RepID=M5G2Y2_DACPD|nr:uncharacterized protein DACRYDRAFT_115329 [Dacryopinax primogenitus]EJU03059.1 hypothetical protein DACRYDRAFT_115329 [Dacryopinax primogenitus]